MLTTVTFRLGYMFDLPSDMIVLPYSTNGFIMDFVE